MMTKMMFALGAAAVALSAVPASARPHCTQWRHGRCVTWQRAGAWHRGQGGWNVGYRFAPSYAYTEYSALPQPLVTRYHLRQDWRYVNQGGRVYVVNPHTYRVTRVIMAP